MKTLLFPHRFQKVGWIILALSLIIDIIILFEGFNSGLIELFEGFDNGGYLTNNIAIIGTIIGAILVTCSKEKREDEMIAHIRLNSLLAALYINYALLIVAALALYDLDFLNVMMYNMFTILLIFTVVFRYKIWRMKKGVEDEQ